VMFDEGCSPQTMRGCEPWFGAGVRGIGHHQPVVDSAKCQPGHSRTNARLMLIEDDFILRAHFAELLMLEGYTVTCAADGEEALRRLKAEATPALILLDIILPRLDGIRFRQIQLRTPYLRDIPTVALTSRADVCNGRDLGFTDIVRKPVNFDHLVELLARACPRT
jgi:two-component system, chemotaxis family, chemotaxis protein CheY